MKKSILVILFVLFIIGIYFFTPVRGYLSQQNLTELRVWIQDQGIFSPLIFGFIYIGATVFALPGSVLTISGGLLFGTLWGTVINLTSATIGAIFAFIFARYLGRDTIIKFLEKQPMLIGLDERIGRNGFYSVLILRLVPLFPFNALNYSLGLTGVAFRDYALATAIGMAPGTFVYTSLGTASHYINLSDPGSWSDYRVWGPFVLVILLSFIPKMFHIWKTKRV